MARPRKEPTSCASGADGGDVHQQVAAELEGHHLDELGEDDAGEARRPAPPPALRLGQDEQQRGQGGDHDQHVHQGQAEEHLDQQQEGDEEVDPGQQEVHRGFPALPSRSPLRASAARSQPGRGDSPMLAQRALLSSIASPVQTQAGVGQGGAHQQAGEELGRPVVRRPQAPVRGSR